MRLVFVTAAALALMASPALAAKKNYKRVAHVESACWEEVHVPTRKHGTLIRVKQVPCNSFKRFYETVMGRGGHGGGGNGEGGSSGDA